MKGINLTDLRRAVFPLAINLKKHQAIARRKLKLKSPVDWRQLSKNQQALLGKGYLSLRSSGSSHVIMYSDVSLLDEVDLYHELCKAKLYELGFATIESAGLHAIRDCTKDDPIYISDANSAVTIVMETFVNMILFSFFQAESKTARERMSLRFESSDALTTLHTQMGFWGTAGVSYHIAASVNSNLPFPRELVEKAIVRASDGQEIRKEYDVINSLLEELPKLDFNGLERISEQDGMQIIDVIMRLFSAKTGLEC